MKMVMKMLKRYIVNNSPSNIDRFIKMQIEKMIEMVQYQQLRNFWLRTGLKQFLEDVNQFNFIDEKTETLRAPWIVYKLNGGDCDDIAFMVGIYSRTFNYPYRFIYQGLKNKPITHILSEFVHGKNLERVDPFGDKQFENRYVSQWSNII